MNWNSEQPQILTAEEIEAYLKTYGRGPYHPIQYEEFRQLREDYEAEIGWLTHYIGYLTGVMLRYHPELRDELKRSGINKPE